MKKLLFCLPAALLALQPGPAIAAESSPAEEAQEIFKDRNLEAAVRYFVLEKRDNDKPLTEEDLSRLSTIKGIGMGITNLAGLEKCPSLASLDLAQNQISDLSPLKGLSKLQYLNLADNRISDISPLAGVPALQYIELSHNRVRNMQPLSSLTNLASLYLFHNRVTDLSPIVDLPKLTSLYLDNNRLRDISGIGKLKRLSTLSLKNNLIVDIEPLKGLNGLYYLFLENNEIRDITPLAAMLKGDFEGPKEFAPFLNLYLSGNPLHKEAKQQIQELKALGARIH